MIGIRARPFSVASATIGIVIGLGSSAAAMAQTDKVSAAVSEQLRTEQAALQSQQRVTQLDDEASKMLTEYRQILAETQSRKVYVDQLTATVQSQQQEVQSKVQELSEIETTSREVLPTMTKMLATLDQFVKLDAPFLPDERSARLATLKEMMSAADVSISEKYRRIVEAYQIETEYGRTLESYQGKLGDKTVNFLRIGRVALLYQTLNGAETGYWDMQKKDWVEDNHYRDAVKRGVKVANKQSAPDFLVVPVSAPQEAK